ncbi:sterile alpha motif domain-containing protein 1-like [Anopheles cruzii]|uniref:sterile alpha motif domain-containing protein 1-like n=1 Tax=Anopheles cruzii TaxID=68878 RepID=UPI0022EC1813|nr:sterile alpha motif domain-containing protein 1-like [Anopheles cruzii]XP_052870716.1 sterile alpha motif domain-containing protein 1-like [Anopheles cruzii]
MRLIDVVETAITSARRIASATANVASAIEDGLLVSIVLSKLDEDSLARVARRADQQAIPTWKELRDELDKMANQLYYEPKRSKEAGSHAPCPKTPHAPSAPRKTAYVALTPKSAPTPAPTPAPKPAPSPAPRGSGDAKPRRQCYACDQTGHESNFCPELRARSALQCVNYIMERGKCVNCFSRSHKATDCPSEKKCQHCQAKHHTILCSSAVYLEERK